MVNNLGESPYHLGLYNLNEKKKKKKKKEMKKKKNNGG